MRESVLASAYLRVHPRLLVPCVADVVLRVEVLPLEGVGPPDVVDDEQPELLPSAAAEHHGGEAVLADLHAAGLGGGQRSAGLGSEVAASLVAVQHILRRVPLNIRNDVTHRGSTEQTILTAHFPFSR
jgi:hypothetical protein